jgi:hypothetical protein
VRPEAHFAQKRRFYLRVVQILEKLISASPKTDHECCESEQPKLSNTDIQRFENAEKPKAAGGWVLAADCLLLKIGGCDS